MARLNKELTAGIMIPSISMLYIQALCGRAKSIKLMDFDIDHHKPVGVALVEVVIEHLLGIPQNT